MNPLLFKPGDIVRTPMGRTAQVLRLRPDGKRDLVYEDSPEMETVALHPSMLTIVRLAPVTAWRDAARGAKPPTVASYAERPRW